MENEYITKGQSANIDKNTTIDNERLSIHVTVGIPPGQNAQQLSMTHPTPIYVQF